NDREYNSSFKYATNSIKTSKYNPFTFLPLNLFEQFQRIANAYFLFLLILQVIPAISSLSWFTTVVPLVLVLTVTAAKDAIDDIVSTHIKQPDLTAIRLFLPNYSFKGIVCCEPPNNRLDRFTGTLTFGTQKYSLDNERVLLRGCTLRNTDWCFGLVLFAGPETKLMQNCGKSTFKRTSIDRLMNILVLFIFGLLALMCIILAVGNGIWENHAGSKFNAFLPREENTAFSAFLTFWSYIIILNTVVPISLYVSMEVIRLGNSYYINWDRNMYHARTDTPAEARTTTLNEELGQIKYIFSDKTGTLTQNIMTFNKCSINGKSYVDFSFNRLADPKFFFYDHTLVEAIKLELPDAHAFFRLLALCHTVMAEEKKEGDLVYQAQSPDEGALVTAARNFGFVFRSRSPETVTIEEMGIQRSYELLAILDFNNVRKRMSVIVRNPEGKLSLYCKGADTIIYERLHPSCSELMKVTTEHLNEFAGEGLRTLVLAYKDLDEEYFSEWKQRHHESSVALEDREEKLEKLYEEIEKDMMLIGATAIEDKLQDGVAQTIEQLTKAEIKIWVLTGDKQETAENIGYSCNLLREEMNEVFFVAANSPEEVRQELRVKPSYFLSGSSAQVVELVKKYKKAVTLAIGDGANDVSMIKGEFSFITLYNLVYTALPVLGMSLFDQDVNAGWSLEYPQLYVPGQLSQYFSKRAFVMCALHSWYSSLVLFFVPYAATYDTARDDGKDGADYQSFALITQTCLTVTVCLGLDLSYWTVVNHLFVWGSLGMFFILTFTMYTDGLFQLRPSSFAFIGTARNCLNQPNVWLTVALTAILCVLPVAAYRFFYSQISPTINDKVRYKVCQMKEPAPRPRRTRLTRRSTRRSGYAFSHAHGYGDLVTSGRFLRRHAPARSMGLISTGRSPGFKPTGRSAGYSPVGREQNPKQKVEPTSLQMFRAVKDASF
uniref:Phospholipid-transporting ATPase n=1 Tax=Cyprinus carpio TaxID=7962 RepID=A0A8C1S1L4_CYPCA